MSKIGFSALAEPATRDYRIRLELGEPNKENDTWSLTAVAVVSNKKGQPIDNVEVQFYHNGAKIGDAETTEDDGRAVKEFPNLSKGNHFFEAQVVGTDKRGRKSLILKEDRSKSAKKIGDVDVNTSGRDGNYVISVAVTAEDGSPMGGVPVVFLNGGEAHIKETEKGITHHTVQFTEKHREISIQVAGAKEQPEPLVLKGPSLSRLVEMAEAEREDGESNRQVGKRALQMQKGHRTAGSVPFSTKFWASNNFRGNCYLAVSVILLVIGLGVFTFSGPEKPKKTALDLIEERRDNFDEYGWFATDEEINPPEETWRDEWSSPFWKAWWIIFAVAVSARAWAQREEIALAFKRQRTRSSKDMPRETSEKKESGSSKSMIPSVGKLITETAAEVAAETVTEVATKAAKKIFKK